MSESPTSERQLPTPGFVPSPFWADPVGSVAGSATGADLPEPAETPDDVSAVLENCDAVLSEVLTDVLPEIDEASFADPAALGEIGDELDAATGDTDEAGATDAEDAESGEDSDAESDEESEEGEDEEDAAAAERTRFAELVEERVRRARYAHHLTRAVFTPGEAATAVVVERRAAIWVPTLTFVATLVSAAAAVVLATRLHGDPADPTGHQLLVVMITVCLLAAAFGILLRAEVHYERLRPRGRTVRHDVADAYEIVRDAPRRLVRNDAPLDVLRRVSDLLPAAEQLVDALVEYAAEGGSRVREHPAYERILRMRAEVEALEVILAERDEQVLHDRLGRQPRVSDTRELGSDGAPLPRPEQVADYDGLADLVASLDQLD